MPETITQPGPDIAPATVKLPTQAPEAEADTGAATGGQAEHADSGRLLRAWVWMILVSAFGGFLVFGSVSAHYWEVNDRRTLIVPVTEGMQVLDIWRAQLDGLPDVTHQTVLKSVFLLSVFGFIGLSVIALWLATVEILNAPPRDTHDASTGGSSDGVASEAASAPGASLG